MIACPKCGCLRIHTIYHGQGCNDPKCNCAACTYGSHTKQHTEHLHRTCQGCFFDWTDPVKDAA